MPRVLVSDGDLIPVTIQLVEVADSTGEAFYTPLDVEATTKVQAALTEQIAKAKKLKKANALPADATQEAVQQIQIDMVKEQTAKYAELLAAPRRALVAQFKRRCWQLDNLIEIESVDPDTGEPGHIRQREARLKHLLVSWDFTETDGDKEVPIPVEMAGRVYPPEIVDVLLNQYLRQTALTQVKAKNS